MSIATTECPRWRLIEPHYILVPTLPDGTRVEWEHRETARESGRTVRKLFSVPILLDPKDPADFNHPGEIIVCRDIEGARMTRGDYIFLGDPTQGMEPLNDEAEAITDSLRQKWINPVETLPSNGGMSGDESAFMAKMIAAFTQATAVAASGTTQVVPQTDYDALRERLEKLEALIAKGASVADAIPIIGATPKPVAQPAGRRI